MAKGDWWGSFGDGTYNSGPFDSEEKAICAMLCQSVEHSGEPEGFYIGQAEPIEPQCVQGQDIIDIAQEAACEEAGEAAEDWLHNVSHDQEKELTDALGAAFKTWLDRHDLRPTFFKIGNPKTIEAGDPRVVEHFERCDPCKKLRAKYAEGMRKAGEEIQKIIDTPAGEGK